MAGPIAALFDIDETLVHTGGSGKRSWAWAFDRLHGVAADIGDHTSAGETDPQVGRKTFRAVLGREPSHDEMARLYAAYLWHLSEDIRASEGYRVLDGVEDTLRRITDAGIILGLISGAMEGAARIKMEPGQLGRYFVFGAYGSDSPDRAEITRLASRGIPTSRGIRTRGVRRPRTRRERPGRGHPRHPLRPRPT
ncbi:Haloacid dehalogenase OS=Streptomyces antimycoticus OX=68175 GN=SSPO_026190 PE=4 SV=1 [Streptomyces antimycoticus]